MKILKVNSGIVWGFIFQFILSVPVYAGHQADSIRTLQINNLKEQLRWINPEAVKAYLEDVAKESGDKQVQLKEQYQTFCRLYEKTTHLLNQEKLSNEQYNQLKELQNMHRQIMLANPLLDIDKILVARYKLGNRDRRSLGPQLGTPPANYSSMFSGRRSGYDAEITLLSNLRGDIQTTTLYKPETDLPVSDIQLHWDAHRLLFTSLDKERKWQIYEINIDGTGLHQKIECEERDLEFCDANYLPDGRVVATTNIGYNGVPCVHGDDIVANLISYDPSTGAIQRLTFDQDGNWSPIVMPNGRLMYTRWEYTDLTHYFSRIVMHMNPDGTENKALYGSGSYFPNSTFDMKPLSKHSGRFIGIISGHHGIPRSGRLIIFDPAKGRKEEKGMVQELPFRDRPIIPIIKDELVDGVWPHFMKPYPLNDHYFLTAAKLTPDGLWGIYLIDVFDNLTLIAEYEGEGLTSPILLKETEMPPVIPSKIKPDEREATLFIQDIYEGEGSIGIPRGKIKSLRIFAYEYAYIKSPSDHDAQGIQSGWDIKRILGTVPVEEDGSVMFKVPANTPISIQPLDENGAAVQWMRSWLAGMPGEIVSCIGCHEDQNTIPLPKRTVASTQPPRDLAQPKGGVRPFTFALEVQPVLDRNCISCHDGTAAQPDFRGGNMVKYERGRITKIERWMDQSYLNLHPYVYRQGPEADIYVLKPYEYYANNSELIRILETGHHGVKLPEEDLQTLYTWIDLNAPYFGAFTQLQPLNGIDQVKRRQELAEKYSNSKVDWQKEIEEYAAWLKANGDRTPRTPKQTTTGTLKPVKAKGFPFDEQTARRKQQEHNHNEKKVTIAPGVEISFVWIPAGTFIMGDNSHPSTSPAFKTTLKKGFWMSRTEITNEQFTALFPEHDSRYIGQTWKDHTTPGYAANQPAQPVVRVSWDEANAFCRKAKEISRENILLPTETQWEWAARAGAATPFWFGSLTTGFSIYENLADSTLVDLAVTGVNPRPMSPTDPMRQYWDYQPKILDVNDGQLVSAPVASYESNPWGLFDMHGNVAEWTRSTLQPYPLKEAGSQEEKKVVRGGSWIERPKDATATSRKAYYPWQGPFNVGFRIIIEE